MLRSRSNLRREGVCLTAAALVATAMLIVMPSTAAAQVNEGRSDGGATTNELAASVTGLRTVGNDADQAETTGPDDIVPQACGGHVWAPPGLRYSVGISSCGTLGHPGYRHPYTWWVGGDVQACVQLRGYQSGSGLTWFGNGCGYVKRTQFVPWGNNAFNGAIRATSASVLTGVPVSFNG